MAAVDTYKNPAHNRPLDNSAIGAIAITPHDTTELAFISRAVYVGVGGTVEFAFDDGPGPSDTGGKHHEE